LCLLKFFRRVYPPAVPGDHFINVETNHFGQASQSCSAQLLDYFRRIAALTARFNQRYDYFVLSHHVDCLRIDTPYPADFY
jgi:hypothetical protein